MTGRKRSKCHAHEQERKRLTQMKSNTVPRIRIRDRIAFGLRYPYLANEHHHTSSFFHDDESSNGQQGYVTWSPHLFALIQGTKDKRSSLFSLQGHESTIIRAIYEFLVDLWKVYAIQHTTPAFMIGKFRTIEAHGQDPESVLLQGHVIPMRHVLIPKIGRPTYLGSSRQDRPQAAFAKCNFVQFPQLLIDSNKKDGQPREVNVNMMPFILGEKCSLPEYLQCYYETVIQQCPIPNNEVGRVGFLTITEGFVDANQIQRRPGIHIESSTTRPSLHSGET